jgi:hypothetical protein
LPNYKITDPDSGKVITVEAATPEAARLAAIEQLRPTQDDRGRQRLEGFMQPLAGLADMVSRGRQFGTGPNESVGILPMLRGDKSFADRTAGISSAGEENPTQPYTMFRGAGRGAIGIGAMAATGGLSAPLAGASLAGGIAGSEVETATGNPLLGAGVDLLTSLVTGNPSGAYKFATKLKLGGGTAKDVVNVVDTNFTSALQSARSAFARVPDNVGGTVDATKMRDLAQRLVENNAPEDVPGIVRHMSKWPDQISFQTLRRAIGSHANAMRAPGSKGGVAGKVAGELDDLLKQFEAQQTSGSAAQALRAARDGWGAFRRLFPTKGSFAHAVLNPKTAIEKPADAIAYIFNAKNPQGQAKLLSKAVIGDAAAEQGLRRAYLQYLAQNADQKAFRGVVSRFDDTREVAQTLFGPKATALLAKNLRKAASGGGGDLINHPYLIVMTLGGTGAAFGGISPKLTGAVAAGSGAYWAVRHFGATRAQKLFLDAAYDDGLRKILASRASRAEGPEVIAKLSAWAARNAPELLEGESQ